MTNELLWCATLLCNFGGISLAYRLWGKTGLYCWVAMAAILPYTFQWMGYQWTLAAGAALWLVMFLVYRRMRPRSMIIASMALHGLAYAFFFDAAFLYVKRVTPPEIPGSAQGLYTVVTMGLGLFVGTRLTGMVMDRLRDENGFRWRAIFLVPCVTLAICAVAFAVFFKGQEVIAP